MTSFLWHETRDLHHACEEHPVGSAMASGSPPWQWYSDWLQALLDIHSVIDEYSSSEVRRVEKLEEDLSNAFSPRELTVAKNYANNLKTEQDIAGATYVLLGAHLMGGAIMRKRLTVYPTKHLEWDDRKTALKELQKIKERTDIVEEARNCFSTILDVMTEIENLPL